jgi:hypothetical protein
VDLVGGGVASLCCRSRVVGRVRQPRLDTLAGIERGACSPRLDWAHLCTVGAQRIDPIEVLGILPDTPLPYWGWGNIPDQYRRRWDGDDGESPQPGDPWAR